MAPVLSEDIKDLKNLLAGCEKDLRISEIADKADEHIRSPIDILDDHTLRIFMSIAMEVGSWSFKDVIAVEVNTDGSV